MSLPEILISLAITSMLLVGMAAAFHVSASAVEMNDRFFRASQAARVTENIIMSEVRQTSWVKSASATSIRLVTVDGKDKTWTYVPATSTTAGQITVTDNGAGTSHVLCDNVSAARFIAATGTDANNHPCYTSIALVITVQINTNQVTLSGAAAVRSNLVY